MVVQDHIGHMFERGHTREQIAADAYVRTHEIPLFGHQLTRLVEHAIADADLADIVQ